MTKLCLSKRLCIIVFLLLLIGIMPFPKRINITVPVSIDTYTSDEYMLSINGYKLVYAIRDNRIIGIVKLSSKDISVIDTTKHKINVPINKHFEESYEEFTFMYYNYKENIFKSANILCDFDIPYFTIKTEGLTLSSHIDS